MDEQKKHKRHIKQKRKYKQKKIMRFALSVFVIFFLSHFLLFPRTHNWINVFAIKQATSYVTEIADLEIAWLTEGEDTQWPELTITTEWEYCKSLSQLQWSVTYTLTATDESWVAAISFDKWLTREERDGSQKLFLGLELVHEFWTQDTKGNRNYKVHVISDPLCTVASVEVCIELESQQFDEYPWLWEVALTKNNTSTTELNYKQTINQEWCTQFENVPHDEWYIFSLKEKPDRTLQSFTNQDGTVFPIRDWVVAWVSFGDTTKKFTYKTTYVPPSQNASNVTVCLQDRQTDSPIQQEIRLWSDTQIVQQTTSPSWCYTFKNLSSWRYSFDIVWDEYNIVQTLYNKTKIFHTSDKQYLFAPRRSYTFDISMKRVREEVQKITPESEDIFTIQKEPDVCYAETSSLLGANAKWIDYSATAYDNDCRPLAQSKTISAKLINTLYDYNYTRTYCPVPNSYFAPEYLFDDVAANIHLEAINDVRSYCIIQWNTSEIWQLVFRPNDVISVAEAMKILVNTVAVFQWQATIEEPLDTPNWYDVYIPYADSLDLQDVVSVSENPLTKEQAIMLINKVWMYLWIENVRVVWQVNVTTRAWFVYLIAKYFSLEWDTYFLSKKYDNYYLLERMQKKLITMLPHEQYEYLTQTLQAFAETDADTFQKVKLHKQPLLKILQQIRESYYYEHIISSEEPTSRF